ncbi:MAG: GspH/FimT family pseudopilin [Thermomonas sp.]
MGGHRTATASSRGFTLIELLVVLMIMGLVVGLAAAIVRPDDRGLLRIEAERLAQLLDLAAAESRLTGTPMAWTAEGPGYGFWRMTADGDWSEVRDSDLLRARTLPQGMTITGLQVENAPVRGVIRLQFAPYYGAAQSFTITMSLGDARYAVVASPIGEVQVMAGDGASNVTLVRQ